MNLGCKDWALDIIFCMEEFKPLQVWDKEGKKKKSNAGTEGKESDV